MYPPRRCFAWIPILLSIVLTGCSSTIGSRFGGTPQSKSMVVNGERTVSVSSGEPGGQVVAEADPEPKLNPKARISGRVVDEQGDPVCGVTVRLADGGTKGGKDIRATTDKSGAFTLNGLRPGSTYSLIAEAEDDQGPLTGRIKAKTAETGVEISLLSEEAATKAAARKAPRTSRTRPISNRDESTEEPIEDSRPAINREDVAQAVDPNDPLDPGPQPDAGRPKLSLPRSATGWQNNRVAKQTDDPETVATSAETPSRRPRIVPITPGTNEDDEEGPNPLPPALEPGQEDEPAPRKPTSARSKPARPASKTPVKPTDSGEMTLAPETSAVEKSAAPGSSPIERPPTGLAESGPPSLGPEPAAPVLAALTQSAASISGSGPPEMPEVNQPPASNVVANGPPDLPPTPVQPIPQVAPNSPASQPVFASEGAASPPVDPSPSNPADYNPFALVKASTVAAPISDSTGTVPQASPRLAQELAAEEDASDLAAPVPAGPKMKWGDLTANDATKPKPKVEPTKTTIAASFVKRFRPAPASKPEKVDVALAACSYDARLRVIKDFRLPDLEGKPVTFKEIDADYVLIDFWGTWCAPCLQSIPHLIELQKKYGPSHLRVVGIACEEAPPAERRAKVEEVSKKFGINYTVLLSTMDGKPCPVQEALAVQAMPTMILLDRNGQIVWRSTGSTPANESRLDRVLSSRINSAATTRR